MSHNGIIIFTVIWLSLPHACRTQWPSVPCAQLHQQEYHKEYLWTSTLPTTPSLAAYKGRKRKTEGPWPQLSLVGGGYTSYCCSSGVSDISPLQYQDEVLDFLNIRGLF